MLHASPALAARCANLATCRLDDCPRITVDARKALRNSCVRLASVSLRGCKVEPDETFCSIAESSPIYLAAVLLECGQK